MTRRGRVGYALVLVAALTAWSAARADDEDTIDYRKHIMRSMREQAASIAMVLQKKAPADNFATHVRILAVTAAMAKKAFEPKVPGGDAKPEVWSNWADFAKRLDTLVAATDELAKTAEAGGLPAAAPKVEAALSCKACHDKYKVPSKTGQ